MNGQVLTGYKNGARRRGGAFKWGGRGIGAKMVMMKRKRVECRVSRRSREKSRLLSLTLLLYPSLVLSPIRFSQKKMSLASQREASMTTKMLGGEEERMEVVFFFFFCLVVVAE